MTLGKINRSYADMILPNILIGKVNARLNTRISIMIRALESSVSVIVSPNIVSTLRYKPMPPAKATILMME